MSTTANVTWFEITANDTAALDCSEGLLRNLNGSLLSVYWYGPPAAQTA